MTDNAVNIYRTARSMAGMTQERWAEAIGVDVRSVQRYEQGETTPPDDIVATMAMISAHPVLCYWHMTSRPQLGDVLPDVERVPLPQAVVQILVAIADFATLQDGLLKLAADGMISPDEQMEWDGIVKRLDGVTKAALQLKYAEGGR